MKRLFLMLLVAFVCSANADAQGWLGRLKDKAVDAAKRTVENTVEQKTQEAAGSDPGGAFGGGGFLEGRVRQQTGVSGRGVGAAVSGNF